jgi:hypothetical protein
MISATWWTWSGVVGYFQDSSWGKHYSSAQVSGRPIRNTHHPLQTSLLQKTRRPNNQNVRQTPRQVAIRTLQKGLRRQRSEKRHIIRTSTTTRLHRIILLNRPSNNNNNPLPNPFRLPIPAHGRPPTLPALPRPHNHPMPVLHPFHLARRHPRRAPLRLQPRDETERLPLARLRQGSSRSATTDEKAVGHAICGGLGVVC